MLEHSEACSIEQWKCLYGGLQLRYDLNHYVIVEPCCASCKRQEWDKSGMVKVREVTFRFDFKNAQIKDLASHERFPGGGWKSVERGDSELNRTLIQRTMEGRRDAKKRVSKEKFDEIDWSVNWEAEDVETAKEASAKSQAHQAF